MSLSLSKRLQLSLFSSLGAAVLRLLASTWSIRELSPKGRCPATASGTFIYAYWHEYIVFTVGHYRRHKIQALASRSFDGDIISETLLKLGYPAPARGSSSRGGASALKAMLRSLQEHTHVAVTVDGPRGPRRVAQDGVLKLAQLSGKVIIPVGFASSCNLRLKSWDRNLIPLPFSQGVFCFGRPLQVARDSEVDKAMLQRLQSALEASTQRAENAMKSRRSARWRF
jgi:lysophospholipid acyltransferase (LPLAT)-like uncharacterized protein